MLPSRPALEKIVLDALRRAPKEESPIFAWPLVCGPVLSDKTQALAFTAGILKVVVPDITWQAQLRDMAPEFLAALNKFTSIPVHRIEFVIAESRKFSPRSS